MPSLTRHFAELAGSLSYDDLTATGVVRAKASIADAIGCILAGSASGEAASVRAAGLADGGAGRAPVLGSPVRLTASYAALANGTAGHVHDYDDCSPPMIGHPSVPMVAAMLSAAEGTAASGRDMIAAFVAGLEIAARLGRGMNPAHYEAGWHATATLGTLAATVALARLRGLDAGRTVHAIGVAASSSGGIRKNFGSMVKPVHAGLAARNGVVAVQLALAGIEADPAALDGAGSFVDAFGGTAGMPRFELGGPLEIDASGVGIKRYPCCGCTHAALDALLALRLRHGFTGADVASIHCTTNGLVPGILVHHRPETAAQAKFSMEYCLAVAALDGDCGLDQFEEARVAGRDVGDLLRRVTTSVDPAARYENGVYPATVAVLLNDGSCLEQSAREAVGHPDVPLSSAGLERKFAACAGRAMSPAAAQRAFAIIGTLEDLPSIEALVAALCAGPARQRAIRRETKTVARREPQLRHAVGRAAEEQMRTR